MNKRLYLFSLIVLPLALNSCSYQPSATNNDQPTTGIINANQNINQNNDTDTANVNIQTNTNINTNVAQPTMVNINISNFSFNPSTITIKKGSIVTWVNQDSAPHRIASGSGSPANFSSNNLNKGNTYQFTFNQTGTFNYYCAVHPSMTAKIIVTE